VALMPFASEFLDRLRAENAQTAARIAAATRERALKAAEERRMGARRPRATPEDRETPSQ
jgi:hypothetical protein